MTEINALICPICGSNVPKGTMKCQYCQAEIIIAPQGAVHVKTTTTCPNCKKELDGENAFCPKCLSILTNDEEKLNVLRHLQKKIMLEQKNLRRNICSGAMDHIGNDELILFDYAGNGGNTVLTNKRMVIYKQGGFFSEGVSRQIPLTEVISVSEVIWLVVLYVVQWDIKLNTEKETIVIKGVEQNVHDMEPIFTFQIKIASAIDDVIRGKKNIQAIILSLKIPEK